MARKGIVPYILKPIYGSRFSVYDENGLSFFGFRMHFSLIWATSLSDYGPLLYLNYTEDSHPCWLP